MAQGNKGIADLVAGDVGAGASRGRLPPRTGVLGARENRLAELASGRVVSRVHELVDPARCRIWDGHNRDYAALNPENCGDLIESFRAQGRQEVPAIVRRVAGDSDHDFEVICGARRHWTVAWMRANGYPEFLFLVEPRELSDEDAFRVADLENRNRRDLSDYERATDYGRALARYYNGSQQRMAERLNVSKSWLSRYLELARLPSEILSAFGSPHAIGISHAAALAPILRVPVKRQAILDASIGLAREQAELGAVGSPYLAPADVMKRLVAAFIAKPNRQSKAESQVVRAADGIVLVEGRREGKKGDLALTIPGNAIDRRREVLTAVEKLIDTLGRRTPK